MKTFFSLILLCVTFTGFSQNIKDAEKLISSERFDEAIDTLNKIKSANPNDPYVYFTLGQAVLKSYINDPYSDSKTNVAKKAEAYFNEGVKKDSLNPLNYVGLGIMKLFNDNDTISADYLFKKANDMIPSKKKKVHDIHIKTLLKLETSELYGQTPRYYKAVQYYNRLVELRPKMPEVYIANANVLWAQNKASEAIVQYKKALNLENTALTNVMVGKIYYAARNTEEAKNYYENAIKIDPKFAPAYKGLGDVYYKSGKHDLAKLNYAKFVELTGNNIPAKINYLKALYKAEDFEGTITTGIDILKADSSKNYINRLVAYSYADKKDPNFENALTYIQKFFNKAKEDEIIVKDYQYYSKILLGLKRDSSEIRRGIEMLEKAYLADTTKRDAMVDIIKESYRFKVYDIEIKYLLHTINNGNNTLGNYNLLGKAFYYNKDYAKADSIFSIMIAMDTTKDVEPYLWKAYSLSSLDPEMEQGIAKPAFEKILEITENDPDKYKKERFDSYSYLGSFYMFNKPPDYDKAIENIKKSIEVNPSNEQWQLKGYYTLAFAYYKSKQWLNAKAAYDTILKLKPDDQNAPKALKDIDKYLKASANNQ